MRTQLHPVLPPATPTRGEAGWAPETARALWRRKKSLRLSGFKIQCLSQCLVNIPTELPCIVMLFCFVLTERRAKGRSRIIEVEVGLGGMMKMAGGLGKGSTLPHRSLEARLACCAPPPSVRWQSDAASWEPECSALERKPKHSAVFRKTLNKWVPAEVNPRLGKWRQNRNVVPVLFTQHVLDRANQVWDEEKRIQIERRQLSDLDVDGMTVVNAVFNKSDGRCGLYWSGSG